MSRRCPALLAALAAALVLATRPTPVRAAGIIPNTTNGTASYALLNTSPAGTAPVTKVVASVIPPGTIVPPDPGTSPLTILDGSKGFDQNNLKVELGDGKTPSGDPLQALALDFGPQGFQPGGVLNFSVTLDKAFQGAPTLTLPDTPTFLAILHTSTQPPQVGQGVPAGAPSGPPSNQVPEPITLVLWSSGLAGLGLLRARLFRRSHPPRG